MKLILKLVRVMRLECKLLSISVVGNRDGLFTLLPPSLVAGLIPSSLAANTYSTLYFISAE